MRAMTYTRFGAAAEVLQLKDLPTPAPEPGEVTVDLHFSGVNPSDVKARAGSRPGVTKPPFDTVIPHSDGAGVISTVGDGVDPARIGTRVWIWNGQWRRAFGTAAEQITLPSEQAVLLPENVSLQVGATLGIPAFTAAHCVFSTGDVSGQTILVQGGAGSVGFLAVQLAKWGGAKVIATARGAGLDHAKAAGADHVIDYTATDLARRILDANNGKPVDRIIEVEFGRNLEVDAEVIAETGRIVAYGSAAEMEPTLPFYPLLFKAVTIEIALIYLLTDAQRQTALSRLNAALTEGFVTSPIGHVFDLEDCAKAHEVVAAGGRTGAVLLRTGIQGSE